MGTHLADRMEVAALSDAELVRGMLDGKESAFEHFADHHIPALYRFAFHRLDRDRELARDIVQTTICKAISKLSTFRGDSALMTWLCACCRMEIAMHFRKKSRPYREVELSDEVVVRMPTPRSEPDGPERGLLRREKADLVHAAIDLLPGHYGQVIEWKYLKDLSVKEIARRLNKGDKATESLLTRAREAFKGGYADLVAGSAAPEVVEY